MLQWREEEQKEKERLIQEHSSPWLGDCIDGESIYHPFFFNEVCTNEVYERKRYTSEALFKTVPDIKYMTDLANKIFVKRYTSFDPMEIVNDFNFMGVFSLNDIPKNKSGYFGAMIVNMNPNTNEYHYVATIWHKSTVLYFDPCGYVPTRTFENWIIENSSCLPGFQFKMNETVFISNESTLGGFYCLYFIYNCLLKKDENCYVKSIFPEPYHYRTNDKMVKTFISTYAIKILSCNI